MTTESYTPPSLITIATAGPHAIPFAYGGASIRAQVEDPVTGAATALDQGTDFSISPPSSETGGDLTLSGAVLAAHTGKKLRIYRRTSEDQGWVGTQGNREKGMERAFDKLARRVQELSVLARAAVRASDPTLSPFKAAPRRMLILNADSAPDVGPDQLPGRILVTNAQGDLAMGSAGIPGAALIYDANGLPVPGPDAGAISGAQAAAVAAAASAASAGTQDTTFLQQSTRVATMGGTAAAMTLTTGGSILAAQDGQTFRVIANVAPSAAATLKVDGMPALQIRTFGASAIPSNHWFIGERLTFTYVGGFWFVEPDSLYNNVSAIYARAVTATFTSGTDVNAGLTAELLNRGGLVSQAGSQYTLLGGKYFVRWSVPGHEVDAHISWLRNVTDNDTPIIGSSAYAPAGASSVSSGVGVISFTGPTIFELRRRCTATKSGNGMGRATGIVNGDGLPVDLFGFIEFTPLKP